MAERGALILNEVLSDELRTALDREAEAQNVTLNDVAGAILAKHFDEHWEYSGKPYRKMALQFKLRVPEGLHLKLRLTAALDSRTVVRGIVISVLASHYDLEAIAPTLSTKECPIMSTTQQESLVATPPPVEAEKDKSGTTTREYVVLEQRAKDGPWVEVKRVTASDVEGALNALGTDLKQDTRYVAVAERYWRPATPKVETTTTVTLNFD